MIKATATTARRTQRSIRRPCGGTLAAATGGAGCGGGTGGGETGGDETASGGGETVGGEAGGGDVGGGCSFITPRFQTGVSPLRDAARRPSTANWPLSRIPSKAKRPSGFSARPLPLLVEPTGIEPVTSTMPL